MSNTMGEPLIITSSQYRDLIGNGHKKNISGGPIIKGTKSNGRSLDGFIDKRRVSPGASVDGGTENTGSVSAALRAMGHYFDLDPKQVNFYIRQLELSKKL